MAAALGLECALNNFSALDHEGMQDFRLGPLRLLLGSGQGGRPVQILDPNRVQQLWGVWNGGGGGGRGARGLGVWNANRPPPLGPVNKRMGLVHETAGVEADRAASVAGPKRAQGTRGGAETQGSVNQS